MSTNVLFGSAHIQALSRSISLFCAALGVIACCSCGISRADGASNSPLAISAFNATPTTIEAGQSSTLTWRVTGATGLSIESSAGTASGSGGLTASSSTSVVVNPIVTTSYTLKATNTTGANVTATTTVQVVDKPVINSFAATPSVIQPGQSTTLSWSVAGAATLTIDNGVGVQTGSNNVTISPPQTTTYTMTITGAAGDTATARVQVMVVTPPNILSFTATPKAISAGQSSTLAFTVNGATSLSVDQGIGTVTGETNAFGAISGTLTVMPSATTTYTLTATNMIAGILVASTAQVTVTFSNSFTPVIKSFSSSPASVGPGSTVQLSANFAAGDGGTATVDNGVGSLQFQASSVLVTTTVQSPALNSSTTFTLTVSNGANAKTAKWRVPVGNISTLAGFATFSGSSDGQGTFSRFNMPLGLAVDSSGNIYVADSGNNTIRKITPSAVVSTFAGIPNQKGFADGSASSALFNGPAGVAVDSSANVYVTDSGNNSIRKITPAGVVTTIAGDPNQTPGQSDGSGPTASFSNPAGIAIDPSTGNLWVTDQGNHTIRTVTPSGQVTTAAGSPGKVGNFDGPAPVATFNRPSGIAVDAQKNVYVADFSNHTVRMIANGNVTTLAGKPLMFGHTDGTGSVATFNFPSDVAVDADSNVYVADSANREIRRITPGGVVTTIIGNINIDPNTGNPSGPLPATITTVPKIAIDPKNATLYMSLSTHIVTTSPY